MAQKLEDIKRGGGGSIRVGSTGTIGSLMNKELESASSSSQVSSSSKLRKSMDEALISGTQVPAVGPTTPKRQKQKASPEEISVGSSGSSSSRSPELKTWKTKIHKKRPHHRIPILGSENMALEKTTPKREKPARKVSIVEVVDTNCGIPAGSLSNRLKKLSFSKLSHSIV